MARCTHRGCGKEYDPAANGEDSCVYHPGAPVFHEGLKSWSCCADVNKPVLEFDEFMKISGCTKGLHSDEKVAPEAPKSSPNVNLQVKETADGRESYSSGSTISAVATSSPAPPTPLVEEEDDETIAVKAGVTCRRKGCGTTFVSDAVNRKGDGEGTVCKYHPLAPIFREGSKGYLCCKRRVLEFDEFLKIEGCKTGRHVFAPKTSNAVVEEMTTCRIDHYQTLTEVHVSVFAKQADKERSTVEFESNQVTLDLHLPGAKRFARTLDLFGPIDNVASSYKFYGSKVELLLKKQDTRSWPVLEKTTQNLGNISLTFGVGGRTGTIGAKEVVLDETNRARG